MKSRNFIPALVVILATTAFVSCSGKDDKSEEAKIPTEVVNNPATANTSGEGKKGVAVFSFETDNHEFGEIVQGERVTYGFKFKNTGDVPLVISSASASCGCTVPEYTKTPVEPGDEGFINVTFDSSGKSGMVSKTITLIANTVPNTKVLTISADIQVPKEKS